MNTSWWVKPTELNDEQRVLIDLDPDSSVLIIGPPGSGKTNLLLLKASQLVRLKKPNVLILVFTRTLREFIATGAAHYAFSVDKIKTCNKWAADFLKSEGADPIHKLNFTEQRKGLMDQVRQIIDKQGLRNYYDAIILDEAQDYSPEEISIFRQLAPVIYAAADDKQQIYINSEGYFESLKALFKGNTKELKYHYRNGPDICGLADELGKVRESYKAMFPTCNYDDITYPCSISLTPESSIREQVNAAINSLKIQMDAYPGHLLGVVCPTNPILDETLAILKESEIKDKIAQKLPGSSAIVFNEATPICACTAHSAKGLEFRALHVIEVGKIIGKLTRNTAFTTVTRAKTSLSLYYTASLPPYLDKAIQFLYPPASKVNLEDLF